MKLSCWNTFYLVIVIGAWMGVKISPEERANELQRLNRASVALESALNAKGITARRTPPFRSLRSAR